jgi:hypothetical protein
VVKFAVVAYLLYSCRKHEEKEKPKLQAEWLVPVSISTGISRYVLVRKMRFNYKALT